ncbi:E3 ubiquitin-protein ligase Topors-like [Heliangelus exortis]|uniref:E3 ubiquitin-protein ligase Topors-like n=1 Tax=Heliangelus exortis TaxID=472823 RepID=UPI003A8E4500
MADESQWCCPICYGHQEGIASLSPCRHQFCLGCAMRWLQQNQSCPLCRAQTTSIRFSQRSEDDFLMFNWSESTEPLVEDYEDEQAAEEPMPSPLVGGFPPQVWANFFRSHPFNIRPLLPWLRREIEGIFEEAWFMVRALEVTVVARLCEYGLDVEQLLESLRYCVPGNPEPFVRQLIAMASQVCSSELQLHLEQQIPEASSSPTTSPAATRSSPSFQTPDCSFNSSSILAGSDMEGHPSTVEPALHRVPRNPSSVPVAMDQEEPEEDLGVVLPRPSAQGCGHSPSTPGQGRDRSPRGPRRPPKRRASSPQDSP